MSAVLQSYRIQAATGIHQGDRAYQQDQVCFLIHPRVTGCVLGVVADGMGGKSGGRKASDQVMLTSRQIFDRFDPAKDDAQVIGAQIAKESHLVIKLTAISAEEEPHSTVAGFILLPDRSACVFHVGDSRVYHFRGASMVSRTKDHSYVQKLVDEGKLAEEDADDHPKSNLLIGSLGSSKEPPVSTRLIESLQIGDSLMACSDGLWHYVSVAELADALAHKMPQEACDDVMGKARSRASGRGDNLSMVMARLDLMG